MQSTTYIEHCLSMHSVVRLVAQAQSALLASALCALSCVIMLHHAPGGHLLHLAFELCIYPQSSPFIFQPIISMTGAWFHCQGLMARRLRVVFTKSGT